MKNIYRLQFIEALVIIAEAGSIRGAAETMGVSQPALTKTLRQLEHELGVVLFERTSRGVVPSKVGQQVLVRARAIRREMNRLIEEVNHFKGGFDGQIDLVVSPVISVHILPPAIARFRRNYPLAKIYLSTGTYPVALQPLRDGLIDMVVGPIPPRSQIHDLESEYLFDSEVVLITSSRSPWRHARSLADLTEAPWIQLGGTGGPGENFKEVFEMRGLPTPEVKTSSESYVNILALVEQLDAVCSFPARLIDQLGVNREIVKIPVAESLEPARVGIIRRAGVPFTPAAEHLATWIRRIAASEANDNLKL